VIFFLVYSPFRELSPGKARLSLLGSL
jgi:hypothetical protein